jgi:hypothetical protein
MQSVERIDGSFACHLHILRSEILLQPERTTLKRSDLHLFKSQGSAMGRLVHGIGVMAQRKKLSKHQGRVTTYKEL